MCILVYMIHVLCIGCQHDAARIIYVGWPFRINKWITITTLFHKYFYTYICTKPKFKKKNCMISWHNIITYVKKLYKFVSVLK